MQTNKLRFIYTDDFQDSWASFGLTKQQQEAFELKLVRFYCNPPLNNYGKWFPGEIIAGTGGAYKYRYPDPNSNYGKSGGYRIIYFVVHHNSVLFFDIYSKHDKASLTKAEKDNLRKFAQQLKRKGSSL